MICKYCGTDIYEGSKFCPECGKRVDVETILPKDEPSIALTEQEDQSIELSLDAMEQETTAENKIWYYIEAGETKGGFTESQMLDFVQNGLITKNTYVWREGDADWRYACNSLLGSFFDEPTQEYVESDKTSFDEKKEWYYADAMNNQHGPYTQKEMVKFIQNGTINKKNYVWKPGLAEWVFLNDSDLSGYAAQEVRNKVQNKTKETNNRSFVPTVVQNKSIALAVILSFVTCGLYSIYWMYSMVRDVNNIASSQGKQPVFEAGLAVLLNFVTCGLFGFYLFWKVGKSLGTCTNKFGNKMEDTSIVMMLLAIFGLAIVSMCIAQSQINECA